MRVKRSLKNSKNFSSNMNNEEIKRFILKKLIIKLNKSYYENNNPLVSDGEYDILKTEILSLEKKYNFLDHKESPSKKLVLDLQKF